MLTLHHKSRKGASGRKFSPVVADTLVLYNLDQMGPRRFAVSATTLAHQLRVVGNGVHVGDGMVSSAALEKRQVPFSGRQDEEAGACCYMAL